MPSRRSGHDAARPDQANKAGLGNGQSRAERRQEDSHRAHDQDNRRDGRKMLPAERAQRCRRQRGCEHDEDTGHQDGGNAFLEAAHFLDGSETGIGNDQAEHGHGDKAGLGRELVGQRVADQDSGKHERRLHRFRHPAAAEGVRQGDARDETQQGANRDSEGQGESGRADAVAELGLMDGFEHENGRKGTDWIVDNAFPFHHRGDARRQFRLPQQGKDHGRAGNGQQCPDHRGNVPGQTSNEVQGQRGQAPAQGKGQNHHAANCG